MRFRSRRVWISAGLAAAGVCLVGAALGWAGLAARSAASSNMIIQCTPPACQPGERYICRSGNCPGGCGTGCATDIPAAITSTHPPPVCTPPACQANETYFCAGACPGGCGTTCATQTPAAASGLTGQVRIGPACPVVRIDTPCPDQPYSATLTLLDQTGQVVAQIESDPQGNFQVAVPPGHYTLHPVTSGITRAPDQEVAVAAGQWVSVTITYDSGLR